MQDTTMSALAKNANIVTDGGVVTLRGLVRTDVERDAIEAAAKELAGVKQVDNQLEIERAR